jgi:hypothetical protein
MVHRITAYEFSDTAFVVGSDAVVCIARLSDVQAIMSLDELDTAISGYASYRQVPWMGRFVGVWGRKNCQRLRRFLRERGAEVELVKERPSRLRLTSYTTKGTRAKVRSVGQLSRAADDS